MGALHGVASEAASRPSACDLRKSRSLMTATAITAAVLVLEVVGGILSGSLALLSDSAHAFTDVFSLVLSLLALRLACRVPTNQHTYGLHRAEILAALANGVSLIVISAVIGYAAWQRFFSPPEIKTTEMLAVAVVGLIANGYVLLGLRGHSHDLNLRSAYLHVMGDLLASVGVVAGAAIMALTGLYLLDPIISAGIGLLILVGAVRVTREATHILLQGVPRDLDLREIVAAIQAQPDVTAVHNIRIWAVCSNAYVLTAHVVTCPDTEAQRVALRDALRGMLYDRFGVVEATLELECEPTPDEQMLQALRHAEREPDEHNHVHE